LKYQEKLSALSAEVANTCLGSPLLPNSSDATVTYKAMKASLSNNNNNNKSISLQKLAKRLAIRNRGIEFVKYNK